MSVTPLRSIIMSGGQGDAVMAANGLHALLQLAPSILAADATAYTRSIATPIIAALLPELRATSIEQSHGTAHPRYYTSAGSSGSTLLRNWFGADYYVNFAVPRRMASRGYAPADWLTRGFEKLNEWKLFGSHDWRRVSPAYYGLRMWTPVAAALGFNAVDLFRGLYQSLPVLRARLLAHAAAQPVTIRPLRVAIFPLGKAYQTMPPEFVAALVDGLDSTEYACYFAPDEPAMGRYQAQGLHCEITADVNAVLHAVTASEVVATVDSFVSHLAQIGARRHVAFMSHDLPEHTLHPAAASQRVFTPMPCVPCNYSLRENHNLCADGRPACGVYSDAAYLAHGRALLHTGPSP
ncbi:MAG: hypothetical protein KDI42_04310 [Gammaproteobacteria bacterium]|nr:hypothetical protein [Gammaproteobacteria bacterium]